MDERIIGLLEQQLAELRVIRQRLEGLEQRFDQLAASSAERPKAGLFRKTANVGSGKVLDTLFGKIAAARKEAEKPAASVEPEKPVKVEGYDELKEAIITVLFEAGTWMTFEKIYQKLQMNGAPLPADRPKLVVRKLLYNSKLFRMLRGTFSLVEGIHPGTVLPAQTPEALQEAEAAAEQADAAAEAEAIAAEAAPVAQGNAPEPVAAEEPALEEAVAPAVEEAPAPAAPAPPAPATPAPAAPRVGGSAIPPGHYTKALEAILGTDIRVRVKKDS